ncbi:hypothetical protein A2U01_0084313, partial [Trifolium medium]|nr:hypothetical protein [Trifolium medium]
MREAPFSERSSPPSMEGEDLGTCPEHQRNVVFGRSGLIRYMKEYDVRTLKVCK